MSMPFINEMIEFISYKTRFKGRLAIILGSGLGGFADQLENRLVIPYKNIPKYPQSTVEGHSGELVFGSMQGVDLIAAKGRFHFYEGHDFQTVTLPIRLFHKLGVDHLIITNAAGSMDKVNPPGTLMVVTGHLDCTFRHSMNDPFIQKGFPYHDPGFIELAHLAAQKTGIKLADGNYCWALGPAYETPAEIEYFKTLGGNAAGMSTVPEILTAAELGMRVLTISCLTNYAAGITDQPLTHREVIETADQTSAKFLGLLTHTIKLLEEDL